MEIWGEQISDGQAFAAQLKCLGKIEMLHLNFKYFPHNFEFLNFLNS